MHSSDSILTVGQRDRDRSASRLVATICFIQFYAHFVCIGHEIFDASWPSTSLHGAVRTAWSQIPLLACTAALYLCGRGLWFGRGRQRRWLCLGLFGSLAMLVLDATATTIASVASGEGHSTIFINPPSWMSWRMHSYLDGVQAALTYLPITSVLVCLWLVTRPESRIQAGQRAAWVYCAAAYCLSSIPAALFRNSLVREVFDSTAWQLTEVEIGHYAAATSYSFLLAATGFFLAGGSRPARLGALLVSVVCAVACWYKWFPLYSFVQSATRSLLHTLPFSTAAEVPYLWTQHDFFGLLVYPVHHVLPWLLIACYAWRVPMRRLPDDGAPYPRHYCTHCLYNLHGIANANRCPECGRLLTEATAQPV